MKNNQSLTANGRVDSQMQNAYDPWNIRDERQWCILEMLGIGAALLDPEMRVLELNAIIRQNSPESLLWQGARCFRFLCGVPHPDTCPYCPAVKTLRDGLPHDAVIDMMVDGELQRFRLLATPVVNAMGKVTNVIVAKQSVQLEQQEEKNNRCLAQAVQQASEAMVITDALGYIESVNRALEQCVGFSGQELQGKNWRILCGPDQEDLLRCEIEPYLAGGNTWRGVFTYRKRDGTARPSETAISPVRNAQGDVTHYVSMSRDITHEMQLESQLFQAQKMEAVGILAGGIAHDFNNILQALLGYTELAEIETRENAQAAQYIAEIRTAAERASDLVRQILAFSRKTERAKCPVRIQTIIREVAKLLHGILPSTIEIRSRIPEDSGEVFGDPSQLHQVLMNLATNAYHAMRETGGVLEILLETIDLDSQHSSVYPELKPGRFAKITVRDNGCGMSEYTLNHIFEPFFTTKKNGDGTGLGLAMVHGIVKSHGGLISVNSHMGMGAVFSVFLPLLPQKALDSDCKSVPRLPETGTGHILLVDDESPIVQSETFALEALGYTVSGYTDSMAALKAFEKEPGAFDVVITDQTMPSLTGIELARQMLKIRPGISVILCTGYSESVDEKQAMAAGIRKFMMKPATREELARVIQNIIHQI